jgi:hypothetical protein
MNGLKNFSRRPRFPTQFGLLWSLCTALLALTEARRLPEWCRETCVARTSSVTSVVCTLF